VGTARALSTLRRRLRPLAHSTGGRQSTSLKTASIRGYIDGTLGQQGKAQKLAPKAGEPTHTTPEDDAEFPKVNHYLMIFGGS
jgi:hypothetical protein